MDVIKLAQHGLLTGFVVWGLLPSVHAKTWVLTDTSRISFDGGVSKSMLKKSRLDFDKIGKCE